MGSQLTLVSVRIECDLSHTVGLTENHFVREKIHIYCQKCSECAARVRTKEKHTEVFFHHILDTLSQAR